MTVGRSGSGAHGLMGLCALLLMLACTVMGTAGTASAVDAGAGEGATGPNATHTEAPLSAASAAAPVATSVPVAQQPDVRDVDGDRPSRCSESERAPDPMLTPRHHVEPAPPAAVIPAPAPPAEVLVDRSHLPAHGIPARPPDLATLSVLRI
ncbi:hypothetical protein PJ985_13980 [Streptomyces sp. ACA25]|uniref:hypothetical protein n=1 Tax=Streptomyces sp. ACA25 TaxID=3022596 RepID=UPI0023070DDC|nr:hypothetical protein [Streptomyces sp. ACA25]MDB1088677.1 hypothetical protein [Streptomyces sp. ACA25]